MNVTTDTELAEEADTATAALNKFTDALVNMEKEIRAAAIKDMVRIAGLLRPKLEESQ